MKKYLYSKEPGEGGISYAMYFIAIVVVMVLFVFFIFEANMYVIEESIENGLHIAELKTLSANQAEIDETNNRTDEFERDLNILHIITEADPSSSSLTQRERDQVEKVAEEFSTTLCDHLGLDGSTPATGILKDMCPEGSRVVIASDRNKKPISDLGSPGLVIYEPVYSRTVKKTGSIPGDDMNFDITYSINGWVIYEVLFDQDNKPIASAIEKKLASREFKLPYQYSYLDKENNGKLEGATIQASVLLDVNGVKNIFDGVDTNPGEVSPIFSNSPTINTYNLSVVQSADIVPADQDNRKQP